MALVLSFSFACILELYLGPVGWGVLLKILIQYSRRV